MWKMASVPLSRFPTASTTAARPGRSPTHVSGQQQEQGSEDQLLAGIGKPGPRPSIEHESDGIGLCCPRYPALVLDAKADEDPLRSPSRQRSFLAGFALRAG